MTALTICVARDVTEDAHWGPITAIFQGEGRADGHPPAIDPRPGVAEPRLIVATVVEWKKPIGAVAPARHEALGATALHVAAADDAVHAHDVRFIAVARHEKLVRA